jgi:hypothetical protein
MEADYFYDEPRLGLGGGCPFLQFLFRLPEEPSPRKKKIHLAAARVVYSGGRPFTMAL